MLALQNSTELDDIESLPEQDEGSIAIKSTAEVVQPTELDLLTIDSGPNISSYPRITLNLAKEALPFLANRAIEISTDFVAIAMLARLNPDTLAAASLISTGQALLRGVNATGLYYAAELAGQAKSKNNPQELSVVLKYTWVFAAGLSVPAVICATFSGSILKALGQNASIADIVQGYMRAYAWGIPATLLFIGNQQVSLGIAQPSLVLAITALSKPLTLFFGYGLMHGKFYLPKFGPSGLGYANAITANLGLLGFVISMPLLKELRSSRLIQFRDLRNYSILVTLIKRGIPISIYAAFELGSVMASVILISKGGKTNLAAAEPALQFGSYLANTTYAIATTTGILVSREIAQQQLVNARRYGIVSNAICLLIPSTATLVYFVSGNLYLRPFIHLDQTTNKELITKAKILLTINLLGQIADGIRNSNTGALRGHANTHFPMLTNVVATLGINLPLALVAVSLFASAPEEILLARNIAIVTEAMAILSKWVYEAFDLSSKFSTCWPALKNKLRENSTTLWRPNFFRGNSEALPSAVIESPEQEVRYRPSCGIL